ncbi:MAG TPA: SRPBCC domain-containing protein [Pseudomonadales bacterium]|nr:SRPBCC domain-containing protein [Pseudomonadales bacterium]
MRIEDSFTVPASIDVVWRALMDPEIVAPCIPGCREVTALGPTSYRAAVSVEVGPIKANFNVQVDIRDLREPRFVATTTRGEEGTRASTLSAESELRLEEFEGGTRVGYVSEVALVGRLGKFGLGILRKKGEALGRAFADNLRARIAEPSHPA